MKAKFVYEAIGDILKPKSEEDIMSLIGDLSPNKLLVKSVTSGFFPGVKEALKNGADIHTGGEYALQRASQFGHYDIVKLLLKHDANVHAWNDFPLRWASNNGHYDIVKLLLDNGADIHVIGDEALRVASLNGHYDVVKLLKKWMEKDES